MNNEDLKQRSYIEFFYLGLLGLLWGMPYALTKIALSTIQPISLVAGRVLLAAVALWLFVIIRRCTMPRLLDFVPAIILQGVIACVIPYTLIAYGQKTIDSGLAAILNSVTPVFVCLISSVWTRHERLTAFRWLGIAVGLGGVVLVAGATALLGLGRTLPGQGAIVLATFSSALSAIYGRRFINVVPEVTAAGTLSIATLVMVPLCLVLEQPFHTAPSMASLLAIGINGVAATALGFTLYFRLIRTLGSMGVASVGYLKPGFGVLIACTFLDERLTWPMIGGLIAILAGVAILNQRAAERETAPRIGLDARAA